MLALSWEAARDFVMTLRPLPIGDAERSPGAPADRLLTRPDFAWAFLRRNPRYRLIARARSATRGAEDLAQPWGLQFLADPDDPRTTQVFWRPDAAPGHVVRLQPTGEGARLRLWTEVVAHRWGQDGMHLKLRCGLQIHVQAADLERPLAAVLPISGSFTAALRAAGDLERGLRGERVHGDLTPQQQLRLSRMLDAYEAIEAQATYRQVALQLFGQEAIDRHDWRTSSVRDTTIRLVRAARAMVAGGYRDLLAGCRATG